ncbi:MAG: TIGR04255 family protein [Candidatus Odinarchaeota archaeon]
MKRIVYFGKRTLNVFTISLSYEKLLPGIELKEIYPFAMNIEEFYPKKPILGLLKRHLTEIHLAPFTFWDENDKNRVEIGQDFLVFTFSDYLKWEKELPKVMKVFKALSDIVELPNISKIVLTYVDIFPIPKESFIYNKYFTMPSFDFDHEWKIKFHDANLGFVPFEEDSEEGKKKIVLRFRSIVNNHDEFNYNFRLETVGSFDNLRMPSNPEHLKSHLDECHDRIEDHFITFLTDEYRKDIELEVKDY